MRLPNADRAVVDPAKIRDYLLSHEHEVGGSKAIVFESVGYQSQSWELLRTDLLAIAVLPGAEFTGLTRHGRKFRLPASLLGPAGRELVVTTVWIVRWEEDFPRFVTAYLGVRS